MSIHSRLRKGDTVWVARKSDPKIEGTIERQRTYNLLDDLEPLEGVVVLWRKGEECVEEIVSEEELIVVDTLPKLGPRWV